MISIQRVVVVSYSDFLARSHANDFRLLVNDRIYQAAFPAMCLGRESDREITTTKRGKRIATSIEGTLTGLGRSTTRPDRQGQGRIEIELMGGATASAVGAHSLERIAVVGGARIVRGSGSSLKGRKVPPKYRAPSGETWAGRGGRPGWLVAAIKGGKKLDDFLIEKSGQKGRRKRRSKR